MKTAFNLPVAESNKSPLHLLFEMATNSISVLWYGKMPLTLMGVSVYQYTGEEAMMKSARQLFRNILTGPFQPETVTACFQLPASLLLPEAHYDPLAAPALLDLLYGEKEASEVITETIPGRGIHQIYAQPIAWHEMFQQAFPNCRFYHSSTLQLQSIPKENELYAIVYHDCIKLMLHKKGVLQIVQQYAYTSPDDVLYHLLLICSEFSMPTTEVTLKLAGMVDRDSALYNKLHHYFVLISMADLPEDSGNLLPEYPSHFFSHLMQLASCVS